MNRYLRTLLAAAPLLAAGTPANAQSADDAVGRTRWAYMHTLLQKTLLKVDVLTIDLCFDAATARRFSTVAARPRLVGADADFITRAALDGQRALARVEFLRDITLADFLDGIGEDFQNAVATGFMADSVSRAITSQLPVWYSFLEQRGIKKADQLVYEMEREQVRTVLVGYDGKVLLDRTERGRARRNSPLAAWLSPGSPFRSGLLRSLQRDGRRAGVEPLADRCRAGAS